MEFTRKELYILFNALGHYTKYRVNDAPITDDEIDEVTRKIIEEISKKSIDK